MMIPFSSKFPMNMTRIALENCLWRGSTLLKYVRFLENFIDLEIFDMTTFVPIKRGTSAIENFSGRGPI